MNKVIGVRRNSCMVPNVILDELLPDLTNPELRVLLVIDRQTLGWQVDRKTKERKTRDWITHSQFGEKTGLGETSVKKGISGLLRRELIIITNEQNKMLWTAEERREAGRRHERLYYELNLPDEGNHDFVY